MVAVFSSLANFRNGAPFVPHRYPQGVASLDDHVDSSTVASKYLGRVPRDPTTFAEMLFYCGFLENRFFFETDTFYETSK